MPRARHSCLQKTMQSSPRFLLYYRVRVIVRVDDLEGKDFRRARRTQAGFADVSRPQSGTVEISIPSAKERKSEKEIFSSARINIPRKIFLSRERSSRQSSATNVIRHNRSIISLLDNGWDCYESRRAVTPARRIFTFAEAYVLNRVKKSSARNYRPRLRGFFHSHSSYYATVRVA
ncbi:hypothetical protein PUN28_005908 [Cardiocondyla obscurior]|uniref:Uncharacterized protein n=1 Tax=Cardiocondyla obscurior TaxID=286306 RepID=A0AAW2G936_9HYME